jgi:phosphoribosylanthranilate isomerase
MAVLVKICGITAPDAADAALKAGVDLAGLVLHPRSPRHVSDDLAAALADRLRGRVRIAAMMVDPDDAALAAAVRLRPDFIQLHGSESPARVSEIRARHNTPIIKVLSVAEAADLDGVSRYEDVADMLLFDAKPPSGATREGGHGAAFDWQILNGRTFARPWLLAGGLDPDNVARAVRLTGAPGVDVSSGVEVEPGRKSPALIAAFTAAARAAHYASEASS